MTQIERARLALVGQYCQYRNPSGHVCPHLYHIRQWNSERDTYLVSQMGIDSDGYRLVSGDLPASGFSLPNPFSSPAII
jgi:hypothetical protein